MFALPPLQPPSTATELERREYTEECHYPQGTSFVVPVCFHSKNERETPMTRPWVAGFNLKAGCRKRGPFPEILTREISARHRAGDREPPSERVGRADALQRGIPMLAETHRRREECGGGYTEDDTVLHCALLYCAVFFCTVYFGIVYLHGRRPPSGRVIRVSWAQYSKMNTHRGRPRICFFNWRQVDVTLSKGMV